MANRVQEDHKLIVGIEGSRSGDVPRHSPKQSIPGKRGIVYFNADGSSESMSGNTPSIDEDGNKEEGTTQPGAGGAGSGASGGKYNSGNATEDVGIDDPYPIDDPTQTGSGIFSVDSMTLGDMVKGFSGIMDCATGDPVDIRLDGQFTAPDGWGDPDTPPYPEGYESGYYWAAYINAWYVKYAYQNIVEQLQIVNPSTTFTTSVIDADSVQFYADGSPFVIANRRTCGIGGSLTDFWTGNDSAYYCSTHPPVLEAWPSEKPMQLSYNSETGQYETHPMDSNVTTAYSKPVNSFQLCNQAGEQIKSYMLADGGQAIYNATTGIATFVDSTGKVTGFGDAQAIAHRQPR